MNLSSHSDKINLVRQIGFYAKGLVYGLIGALAAMAAFGLGGDIKGRKGIVNFLMELPAGKLLVGLVALGLLAYSLWRFYEMVEDPDGNGQKHRWATRLRYLYSGLLYAAIALSFASPLLGNLGSSGGSSQGGGKKKAMLAEMLEKDWGVWVIGAIALIVAGQAVWQFYRGYSGKYMKKIDSTPANRHEYELVRKSGKFGYMARGVVFGILSFFLVKVILDHNANAYKGTEGAFQYLLSLDYGSILMGAVALGLLGYGIFCILVARHSNLTRVG